MADEADIAQGSEERHLEMSLSNALQAAKFEPGTQGECEGCGEWKSRIVRGHCARCRDEHRLP